MRREVFREVGSAVDEARSAPSQERPAEAAHARLVDNTAVVTEASGAMKNRQVDPRQVGPEAGGHTTAPISPLVRSSASGALDRTCASSGRRTDLAVETVRRNALVDLVVQSAELLVGSSNRLPPLAPSSPPWPSLPALRGCWRSAE